MATVLSIFTCIFIQILKAQANIWYEPMNTAATLLWQGATPTILTNDALCPDPYTHCWEISASASTSIVYTASTFGYTNVELAYYASANGIKNWKSLCSIEYSVDNTNWINIQQITSNGVVATGPYNAWTVDEIAALSIRLTYTGTGHSCYFTEIRLSGTAITAQPTTSTLVPSTTSTATSTTNTPSPTATSSTKSTTASTTTYSTQPTIVSTTEGTDSTQPNIVSTAEGTDSTQPTIDTTTSSTYTTASTTINSHETATETTRDLYCNPDYYSCNITCAVENACVAIAIHANADTESISLHCLRSNACQNITVSAVNTQLVLNCVASYACKKLNFVMLGSSVTINATLKYALSQSTFTFASSAVMIACSSTSAESACYENIWYIGDYFHVSCYGGGCREFGTLHTDTSVTRLEVDIYGCGECWSSADCIDEWTVYCGDNPFSPYTFDGEQCTASGIALFMGSYEDCDCLGLEEKMVFKENVDDDSQCIQSTFDKGGLLSPGRFPTYVYIGAAVTLCLLCCGLKQCCCKKKKYEPPNNTWAEDEMGAIANAAVVVSQPVVAQPPTIPIMFVDSLNMTEQPQSVMHDIRHVHVPSRSDMIVPVHGYNDSIASAPSAPQDDGTPPPAYEEVALSGGNDDALEGFGANVTVM